MTTTKSFFKTLLAILLFLPVLLVFTACGGDDKKGQTQKNYEVLLGTIAKMAQQGSYTATSLGEESEQSTTTNYVKVDGAWQQQGQPTQDASSRKTKDVATYNSTTGEYAANDYDNIPANGNDPERWVVNPEDSEYVVMKTVENQTKYVHYFAEYDSWEDELIYQAEFVSNNHAAHVFGFAEAGKEMSSMVVGKNYEDALEFLKEMAPMMLYTILRNIDMDKYTLTIDPDLTITQSGDTYKLKVTLAAVLTKKPQQQNTTVQVAATDVALNANMTLSIDYTKDRILGFSSNMSATTTMTAENDTNKRVETTVYSDVNSATFAYSYTASEMPSNFDDYPALDDTENAEVSAAYCLDGKEIGSCSYTWGEELTFNDIDYEVSAYYIPENTKVLSWYADKECTQKLDEETFTVTYQSWEKPMYYAKLAPEDGYVLVKQNFGKALTAQEAQQVNAFYGTNYKAGDFYAYYDSEYVAVEQGGTYVLPEVYETYWVDYDVTKITYTNGTEVTANITNIQSAIELNIYVDEQDLK